MTPWRSKLYQSHETDQNPQITTAILRVKYSAPILLWQVHNLKNYRLINVTSISP